MSDHTEAINFFDSLRQHVDELRLAHAAAYHRDNDECALCGPNLERVVYHQCYKCGHLIPLLRTELEAARVFRE